jgi:hypothetical protein
MWFPLDTQTAQLNAAGTWEIDFPPANKGRELQWITLQGPVLSSCSVYLETIFIDTTARGDFNRADYYKGIPIASGQQLRLVWSVGSGTAPRATIGCTDGDTELAAALTGNGQLFTAG